MRFSGVSALAIWNNAVRTLSNFGAALAASTTATTSLAGAASVDLRPAAGLVNITTISVVTGAAATAGIVIQHFDGASTIQLVVTAATPNTSGAFHAVNANAVGLRILNNDATHAGFYIQTSVQFKP